ncbi:MAG: LysE family transporter [bacterium]|nr:LysE family transporter [bacterium]MDD5757327.1 LysE family transporter [bacterium]
MTYISIFAVSFTIALSGALMPGPLLTAVIYESTRHGSKTGPLFILGHAVLEILMIAGIIFGFSQFISTPLALRIIAIAGSIILFGFGLSMLISLPHLTLLQTVTPTKPSSLVWLGVTMSLTNPYWTIWWVTIGLGLVLAAQKQGWLAIIVFFLGHISADLGWYSLVALMIHKGKKFISDKIYRGLVLFCALALIAFSVWFVLRH